METANKLVGDKKTIRGWVFYDWANSVYNLVISSAIFPIYYDAVTTKQYLAEQGWEKLPKGQSTLVEFFGMEMSSSVLFSYVLSASFLTVAILSPILSGVADYSGNKKNFLKFFCYLGVVSCISMFFFDPKNLEWSMLSVFFASIGFWNSLVFYNAYLPEIAPAKDHDSISARGFTMGYFGAMILLILCLVWIQATPKDFTILGKKSEWCFVAVGLWWLGFSQITYRALPGNKKNDRSKKEFYRKDSKN